MDALSDAGLHVGSLGATSPVANRTPRQPRMVEGSARTAVSLEDRARMFGSSAAVLELVQRSAERFAEILEMLDDVRAASTMTGFSVGVQTGTGSQVDQYA